jgi:hypothetical protein
MMTAKSRYWDHERCSWVTYEAADAAATTGGTPELLPEQRADEEAAPAPADTSLPVVTS